MIPEELKLKNTVKHPTSLLIGGLNKLGLEIAEALLEQGGYVIFVDNYSEASIKLPEFFKKDSMVSFVDYTTLPHLDEEIRRLDYIFYFLRESVDPDSKVSTQHFLNFSNYLDSSLTLASKFEAKFLLCSTIRAHQQLIFSQDVSLQTGKHTIYTETEMQRYAESLTLEYVDRVDLDARIVRIGEVIGEGTDFGIKSKFNDLIISAARGEPLVLKKDGLEVEWVVHLLDAAYGVIKAQFSKNTKGEIYSVCYENPFTHLAIAYKIQEVEDGIQEIIFDNESDNLPSLKLYQPAKNLASIGWMPRVPFDRSIKQSIIAAKIFLLEKENGDTTEKGNIVEKIKSFVNLADSQTKIKEDNLDGLGPISKLIAERKRQEELRARSMELANTSIKVKKRRKARSFREKLQDQLWSVTIDVGNKISFLKNKTPFEFFLISLVFLFLIFLYITFVSPIFLITKGSVVINSELKTGISNLDQSKFFAFSKNAGNITLEIESIQKSIQSMQIIFNILGLSSQYESILNNTKLYYDLSTNFQELASTLINLEKYLNQFSNNTQTRLSNESFLSVINVGIDHSDTISAFRNSIPFLLFYIEKIENLVLDIQNFDYQYYPQFIANGLGEINQEILRKIESVKLAKSLQYFPDIMGLDSQRNYAFIVLDNTRPRPIGGEILSFAILGMQNGSLVQTLVQSPLDVKFNFSSINSDLLNEINLRKYNYKIKDNLTLNDLSNIPDIEVFQKVLAEVFQKTFDIEIDGVLTIDLMGLDRFINLFYKGRLPQNLDITGVDFAISNILANVEQANSSEKSLLQKSRVVAQLFSTLIYNFLGDFPNSISLFNQNAQPFLQGREIQVSLLGTNYQKFLRELNIVRKSNDSASTVFSSGIILEDPKFVNSDKFPSIFKISSLQILQNQDILIKNNFRVTTHPTFKEFYYCVPIEIKDSDITINKIPDERFAINKTRSEKCIVINAINETEFSIDLKFSGTNFAKILSNEFEYNFIFPKTLGLLNSMDLEVSIDPSLAITKIEPLSTFQSGKTLYSIDTVSDFNLKLLIAK